MKKFISYRRVSTDKQGASGLGLEAQTEIIKYFVKCEKGEIIMDFQEVHSGKDLNECAVLRKAMTEAKRQGAVLVVAKTDRFRNLRQALEVLDEMGEGNIMFCDLPHTDRFTLTLFFALAERERLITSIRTKQALKAKKERGERLGSPLFVGKDGETEQEKKEREQRAREVWGSSMKKAIQARKDNANNNEANTKAWAVIEGREGTLQQLADILNKAGFMTPKGSTWNRIQVSRLIQRYSRKEAGLC